MAEFPDKFDTHLIVRPNDDPTHPFPDKAQKRDAKKKARRVIAAGLIRFERRISPPA
jgi:hypothetical protein